jgi:hypothetical protein
LPKRIALVKVFASTLLFLFISVPAGGLVSAQVRQDTDKKEESVNSTPENKAAAPLISIELVGGGRLEVEELRETSDGIWYRRGGVTALLDPKRVARIEGLSSGQTGPDSAAPQESPRWSLADAKKVEHFFFTKFGRPLPTSAFGQSEIHDRWGLDHRQGLDVGLHPDSPEGIALVDFLRAEKIPFLVFRNAIPGVATGPHIHIGFPSHRYSRR